MLSSKTLLLGVYTADGIIRLLFLPICYLFMWSPFALLACRYFKLHQSILEYVPKDYKTPDIWPQLFISLVTVILATRLISGLNNGSGKVDGKRRVQLIPYWIPGVRHWGNVVFGGEGWFKSIRDTSITNIFAYNYSGTKHNIILSASLLDRIVGNSNSLEEAEPTKWITLRNAFGMPRSAKAKYLQLLPSTSKTLETQIFKGEQLKKNMSTFLRSLSEALPDLITFNSSIVDQFPWERVAGIELTDGTDEAECDLFALINEFFCRAIIPTITGPQFPDSYELLASDLSTFNKYFYALAMGFPRLFPLPGLPGAKLAKKRLLQNLDRLFNELSNPRAERDIPDDESVSGDDETDADTPTPLTALNDLFSQHDIPTPARSAITLELLHRLSSKAIPLAFWTIVHIYRHSTPDPEKTQEQDRSETPLAQVRKETQGWAEAIQPPSIHPSFPAPPEISFSSLSPLFNPSALTYLRSCIFESRRLYGSSINTAKVTKPINFTENTAPGSEEEWQLDVGSYIDIGLSQRLINTSGAEYLTPDLYKPGRTPNVQSPSPLSATVFDDSEELVTATLIALVAGVTQLWEIAAARKKGVWEQMQEAQVAALGQDVPPVEEKDRKAGVWVVPRAVDGASVMVPKDDVRVRIRRREGLGPKTMRKVR